MLPNIKLEGIETDDSTNAIMTIDYGHHETHEGDAYYYHDVVVLTAASTADYIVTVPNTAKWPHIGFEMTPCDGAATMELFEATDRVGTSAATTFNRNRNITAASTTTIHKGQGGGTTDGTRIMWKREGSGKTSGGQSGTAEERILKQNTAYLFRVTNNSGATNNTTVIIRWYEHSDKR